MKALLRAILRIDVALTRWAKAIDVAKQANSIRIRLNPVREEISKRGAEDHIVKEVFDYIFQMLLDAMPTPNVGVRAEIRADYYEALVELKPTSIASIRHLARAYEQLENYEGAKKCLSRLVSQTQSPEFSSRLVAITSFTKRREELLDRLSEAMDLLSATDSPLYSDNSLAKSERRGLISEYLDKKPLSLLPALSAHTNQEDQFLFAEYLLYKRKIKNGGSINIEEEKIINAFDLRDFVQDKTVCLVANSAALLETYLGNFIDEHDIVIRFNSFAIDPPHTGKKTNIHCSIHLMNHNRHVKVPVRLILGNVGAPWVRVLKKLSKEAQDFVGDDTLKYPLYSKNLCSEKMDTAAPTTGYNIIRLLHLFSNFKYLHLVGFDGYKSGAFRTSEGMKESHAKIHQSSQEQLWIEANSTDVGNHILRLTPHDQLNNLDK